MKESVIADIRILPFGTRSAGVSEYVAACVKVLKEAPGITWQVTPMATMVQGPLERVLDLMREMHEIPFAMGAGRVITTISIDDRRDKQITMESKVKSVSDKL
jgi:uncharacterized protein (TIGR00106 family)